MIRRTIKWFEPSTVILLFSGGDDSSVLVDWANRILRDELSDHVELKAGHLNTNFGLQKTREYVRDFCESRDLPLDEVSVQDVKDDDHYDSVKTYEEIVKEYGFPGSQAHNKVYKWLKSRPIYKLVRDNKEDFYDKVMLVTGARRDESDRRMNLAVQRYRREGARLFCSGILQWTNQDMMDYRRLFDLEKNPANAYIHTSGECLCGAFGTEKELEQLEQWFPEFAEKIKELEHEVQTMYKNGEIDVDDKRHLFWNWERRFRCDANYNQEPPPLCRGCY